MDLLGVVVRRLFLPIGSESCYELLPVDQSSVVLVEHVCYVFHLKAGGVEFGLDDSFNEVISGNQFVVILIHLPKEICQPGLLVIHEFQEAFSPIVPREVVGLFFFLQISQMIVQFSLSFP